MKKTIFSKNELKYLKNTNELEQEHLKNYIYQIRYSIKKKVSNFVINDLDLLLNIKNQGKKYKNLIDDYLIEYLVLKLSKNFPYLILKILNLPEINNYLGI